MILQHQEQLRQLLNDIQARMDYRSIINSLPHLGWNVQLFLQPQQHAIAPSAYVIFFATISRQPSKIQNSIDQPPMW